MDIPTSVTIDCLWINHDKSLLIGESFEVGSSIECICIAVAPVYSDDNWRVGNQTLRNVEPSPYRSRIGSKIGYFCVCGAGERRINGTGGGGRGLAS